LRAFVVEDDPAYSAYVGILARRFGFTVTSASNGQQALEIARTGVHFDLLVIDWQMPGLTGIDLIESLRGEEEYSDVYAIMLTSREDTAARISALRAGYDDFVCKSASELELAEKLNAARRLVSRQRRMDATVRELYGLATRDELTGVFNRRYFFAEAERLLAEEAPVDLLYIDLDNFKIINDTYGHLAGDRILRDVGEVLARATRDDDVIARYGGDEFVMLVVDADEPSLDAVAARIAREISSLRWTFTTEPVSVGVTSGCARSRLLAHPTVTQLLTAGDRDLYKNKWLRKHPDTDPALYEYDTNRAAHVINLVDFPEKASARK
jgi:diguanylate cyclase (GGDEF)-like protein